MAIQWYEITSYCKIGIDWFTSSSATGVSITPKVYRYDEYRTDNYGGSFDEYLSPDPVGAGAWYDLEFGSGSGTRTIDTFATRTYTRTHSSQTVTLKVAWENLGSYSGGFKNLGNGSNTWTLAIDPLASYKVTYNANGGSGAPSAQTKWYGEKLTLSSTKPTRTGYTFQGWATTSNATAAAYAAGGSYTANAATTLYAVWKVVAPAAPSNCTNTRNSDTKNTVKWTRGANADVTYASVKVERSTDGGPWSEIASVAGTATSYADASTSADHYYRYRVRAYNATGYSSYATSGYTYNTPAPPAKVTASRLAQNTVALSVENAARTATGLDLQRSADGEQWSDIPSVSGSPVTEATDAPGGGTFWYRARNTRGELVSDWSPISNAVVTITPPNAPTLVSPASGVVVSKAQEQVTFQWLHNPVDGSAQTAAELRYSLDGGQTWQVVEISGNAASYGLSNAFAVNSTVTWGVRTKGADEDFGPWSGNRSFNVYQEPMVAFAQPTDGFVVENTPIVLRLQYEDPSGELVSASMSISDGSKVVWSRTVDGADYVITSDEWVPDNGAAYVATAEVRSTSTLTASSTRTFSTLFELPTSATAKVEPDPDTGFVNLTVSLVEDDSLQPADHIVLYREVNGERVLLGDNLQDGAGVVDMYAPSNAPYRYVVISVADSGVASTTYVDALLETQWLYFIWDGNVAKGRMNPTASRRLTKPNKRRRHFAKRPSPVSFDDGAVEEQRSVSVLLRTKEEAEAFAQMVWDGGRCVYKSGDGDVMHADVELSDAPALTKPSYYGTVTVEMHRIDGRAL